jgi:hypothetical protein
MAAEFIGNAIGSDDRGTGASGIIGETRLLPVG